jgi:hypothetical protein
VGLLIAGICGLNLPAETPAPQGARKPQDGPPSPRAQERARPPPRKRPRTLPGAQRRPPVREGRPSRTSRLKPTPRGTLLHGSAVWTR